MKNPVVLVHGLWNSPRLFSKLIKHLHSNEPRLLVPNLSHKFGGKSIFSLANQLNEHIELAFGPKIPIDIVGFSMGGLIARVWLQKLGGSFRTSRFISIGTPHKGTLTAQLMPSCVLTGIAEMKIGSDLILDLNSNLDVLKNLECISFFSKWDLMVFPGFHAVLPIGKSHRLPVLTHKQLITHPASLEILADTIFELS